MARIEVDPNYSAPTFSRATAGTDLFKKEDVQALAAAMSTHDHTSGKGVVLTITSAMIAPGTITTEDLAANAATHPYRAKGTTGGPSTTSTGFVLIPEMTFSITVTEPTYVLLTLAVGVVIASGTGLFGWDIAGALVTPGYVITHDAGGGGNRTVTGTTLVQIPSGTTTINGVWRSFTGSTLQADGTEREMVGVVLSR